MAKEMDMAVPINWKNHHVKAFIQWKRNTEIRETVPTHPTLALIGPLQQDQQYNSSTQLYDG